MTIVLHVTVDDEGHFGHALRSARAILDAEDLTEDVVLFPQRWAVNLITPDSPLAAEIEDLVDSGMRVVAGRSCFDANDLPYDTLPDVELVDSAAVGLTRLQAEGANYIKIP